MIKIKILNPHEIVAREKGRLVSRMAPFFINIEAMVEAEIVRQLKEVFRARQIEADITIGDERE